MARNECTNPALGANTSGWQNNSNGITRVAVSGFERPEAAQVTVPALDAFERYIISQTGAAAPGIEYAGSVSYRTDRDTTSLDVYLIFANSAGSLLTKVPHPNNPLGSIAGMVARSMVSGVAPANTALMGVQVSLDNEPVETVLQVSAVRLTSLVTRVYADGDTWGWVWEGVRFNSTSDSGLSTIWPPKAGPATQRELVSVGPPREQSLLSIGSPTRTL